MPKRIQLPREEWSRVEAGAVYVGHPSPWSNPVIHVQIRGPGWRAVAVAMFRRYAEERLRREPDWLEPLRGKDLACWCPLDHPWCHADVLLELANRSES